MVKQLVALREPIPLFLAITIFCIGCTQQPEVSPASSGGKNEISPSAKQNRNLEVLIEELYTTSELGGGEPGGSWLPLMELERSFEEMGQPAIDKLVKLLPNPAKQYRAIEILKRLGPKAQSALPELAKLRGSGNYHAALAIYSIRKNEYEIREASHAQMVKKFHDLFDGQQNALKADPSRQAKTLLVYRREVLSEKGDRVYEYRTPKFGYLLPIEQLAETADEVGSILLITYFERTRPLDYVTYTYRKGRKVVLSRVRQKDQKFRVQLVNPEGTQILGTVNAMDKQNIWNLVSNK